MLLNKAMSLNKTMSLWKLVYLLLVSVGISSCSLNTTPAEKQDYYIQFNGEPTNAKMDEVESFILRKNIQTISGFDVIYGGDNYQRALKIKKIVQEKYGFHVQVKKIQQAGNNVFIVVKNSSNDNEACYTFKLSDFNWYSSSEKDLEKYMGSEVCATNSNDNNERVR